VAAVVIGADSVSYPQTVAQEHGFTLIPCPIILKGKTYLDTRVDLDRVYTSLDSKENLPKTSTANVEDFLRYFEDIGQGKDILHISMSSLFSIQYKNALQARDLAPRGVRIEVVDSRSIGIGVHLIAIVAAQAVKMGKTLDEVLSVVNAITPRIVSFAARDTLYYYDKGGRIFEAKTWAEAEQASSFRSIVEVDAATGGTVRPVARAKTATQIMDKLAELTKERAGGRRLYGAIGYTRGAEERAAKLKETLLSIMAFDWLHLAEESASVAIHSGRGMIDYAFASAL
jgi:DegV family protein with EDD domain